MLFDSLSYVKMMKEAGFDQEKSEAIISVWSDIVKIELATKTDLKLLEQRITINFGSMLTAAVVLIVTLQKIL